jgi:hypothetical protein
LHKVITSHIITVFWKKQCGIYTLFCYMMDQLSNNSLPSKIKFNVEVDSKIPYHGAKIVQAAVRHVIYSTPPGSRLPMSVNMMIKQLMDHGLPEHLAMKLPSQTRRGAPLEVEWKAAFVSGRFLQRLGRYPASNEPSSSPSSSSQQMTSLTTEGDQQPADRNRKTQSFDGWVPDKQKKVMCLLNLFKLESSLNKWSLFFFILLFIRTTIKSQPFFFGCHTKIISSEPPSHYFFYTCRINFVHLMMVLSHIYVLFFFFFFFFSSVHNIIKFK